MKWINFTNATGSRIRINEEKILHCWSNYSKSTHLFRLGVKFVDSSTELYDLTPEEFAKI